MVIKLLIVSDDNLKITPITDIFSSLVRGKSCGECLFAGLCDRFWIVNANGDVYACPSEGIGEEWKFGNIANGYEAIIGSSTFRKFQETIKRLRKACEGCQWYNVCRGGCTIDYELESSSSVGRNVLCASLKQLFRRAKEKLAEYNLIEK